MSEEASRKANKWALQTAAKYLHGAPANEVQAVSILVRDLLEAHADGAVDAGYGFGEACLDFEMDGKPLRVVVSSPTPPQDGDNQ